MDRQIEIKELKYSYDGINNVLENIDLTINRGEFIAIIGKSGSGKSTLLKFFNGLLKTDTGSVEVLGEKINSKSKKMKSLRKKIGIVFQFAEDQFFEDTVLQDIYFAPKVFKMEEEEIQKELLKIKDVFSLSDEILEKHSSQLSGGERRRAAIAGVVIYSPEVLILDEPTIGLDSESKKALMESLKNLNELGKTIIVVSHDLNTIWDKISRVVMLKKGRKVFDGDKEQYLSFSETIDSKLLPSYVSLLMNKRGLKAFNRKDALEKLKSLFAGEIHE